jgi:hypothetical protein
MRPVCCFLYPARAGKGGLHPLITSSVFETTKQERVFKQKAGHRRVVGLKAGQGRKCIA